MEIQNACVLITGASKGIGAAIARSFAKQGAHVVLVARSTDEIEQLAQQLNGSSFSVDLTDPAQLDGFIERVVREISPSTMWSDVVRIGNASYIASWRGFAS